MKDLFKAWEETYLKKKDDFIPRRSTKEEKYSPSPKRSRTEQEDLDIANAKIDLLEKLEGFSSEEELNSEEEAVLEQIKEEDEDDDSNIDTENSEKFTKKSHLKDEVQSEIEALSDTLAILEENVTETKDAETMTDQTITVSVKTNTNTILLVNTGTSIHYDYSTADTMTEIKENNEIEIQTEEYEFIPRTSLVDKQVTLVKSDVFEVAEEAKDEIFDRIEKIEKEYLDIDVQTSTPYIQQEDLEEIYDKHNLDLAQKDEQINNEKIKLSQMMLAIEDQKKLLIQKLNTISEQQEDIDRLAQKILILEHSISEDKDVIENQKETIENLEKKYKQQSQIISESESLINEHAGKIIALEKDLKNKEENYKEKLIEINKLKEDVTLKQNKIQDLSNKYDRLQKEGDILIDRAAALQFQLDEFSSKNKKYKKQLVYITEEKKKEISKLKEKQFNDELEIIKYKALLEQKEKDIAKLLGSKALNQSDIKSIMEGNYTIFSDFERSVLKQDYERKIDQIKEEMSKEIQTKVIKLTDLEEKYSIAQQKVQDLKGEISLIQQNKTKTENKKFKDEKAILLKSFNEKNEKIKILEKEINEYKSKISHLEQFMNEDQKASYIKLQTLTKNMIQLKVKFNKKYNFYAKKNQTK